MSSATRADKSDPNKMSPGCVLKSLIDDPIWALFQKLAHEIRRSC